MLLRRSHTCNRTHALLIVCAGGSTPPAQELLPTPVRGAGAGAATAVSLLLGAVAAAAFPLLRPLGAAVALALAALATALGLVMVAPEVPETKGALRAWLESTAVSAD